MPIEFGLKVMKFSFHFTIFMLQLHSISMDMMSCLFPVL